MSLLQERQKERVRKANAKRQDLTAEQARAARLSPRSNLQEAKAWGVSESVIQHLRTGRTYGPLKPDEQAAAAARRGEFDYRAEGHYQMWHALTVGRQFPVLGRAHLSDRFDRVDARDAVHECACGRLPGDRTPVCGCWPHQEGFAILDGEHRSAPVAERRVA